ncbi:Ig-like domain-containing protein [Candidatus Palauibacter sp.]|uniref:Ig-like domain-containing protein n=1 Tax=Candidatus Palauibacter sp. TaxID=3101350 RepID=UPI003CC6BE88
MVALIASWGAACGDDGGEVTGPRDMPNRSPVAVGEIAAQTAFLGDTVAVDVSNAFRDPDGDPLTFMAASSDPSVVGASVSGSRVSVVGVSRGSATMTVTARDPDGAEARQSFSVEVPNRGPVAVGRIEAQTIFLGEAATVDASPAFSDPDGDELSFAAASSDTASVLASVSGSEVRLEALKRGTATVTVTARDADSLEATVSFEVTVPNRPPAVVGEIRAQTIFLGEAATVDVSAAFGDPDGDPLTFEASSSDTAVVRASSSGSEITLEGLGRGDATVSVTARDTHGGEVDQSFEVAVPNRPPAATGELPPQTLLPGETVTVDVSTAFSDPDGDSLAFEATSSNLGVLGVSLADRVGEVTLEGVARGTATVSGTARDPDGADAGQRFEVTVRNRNPVVVSDLPPRTLLPGQTVTVDVAGVFRDPDGDPLTFEASSSDTEVAAVSAIASEVTVRGVSKGTATVTVTARDDHGGDVRQSFSVKVPNRRPVISGAIPAQTVEEGATTTVDVASYFSDPEGGEARQSFGVTVRPPPPPNQRPVVSSAIPAQTVRENASVSVDLDGHFRDPEGGALDYGATSSDEGVATADISGSDVVVGGVREGTATVTVTATDPGGLSADQEFGVTVRPPPPPNQRPVVSSAIPAQTVRENASVSVDLDGHFRDPEGGALDYGATSSDEGVATADISGSDVVVGGVREGTATVTVTATDPGGLSTDHDFGVTVEPASTNQAPEVTGTIADRTAIRGGELPVQAYRYFSDPDDDELSYTVGTSNAAVATVRRVSPEVFYVTAVSDGQAVITVTAQDPGGLTVSTSFTFAVGNNAPRVTAEAPAVTSSPGQIDTLIFRSYLDEDDVGDELDFSASSTNSGVASVSVQFSALYGFYAEVMGVTAGEATITMTATDRGGLTASTTSLVTVTANRPPRITQGIGSQTLAVDDTLTWNLSDHFSDPDNDRLTYTAAGGIRVSASVTDSTFTLVGASAGISPVRVTATDPSGRTAEITFLAFVTASQSIGGLASSNPRRPGSLDGCGSEGSCGTRGGLPRTAIVGPSTYSSSCPPTASYPSASTEAIDRAIVGSSAS